ncbi:Maf family protein [Aliikangiella maris]|uniref:Maf family protein n=2 Tax=Aliikangiella maris TaxID=3162458 RepID=A0ABV2BS24_9GAMM
MKLSQPIPCSVESIYPVPIILASRSPRRQALLMQIQIAFELFDQNIDETVYHQELAIDYVKRMAHEKAQDAWQRITELKSQINSDTVDIYQQIPLPLLAVLSADTCIALDNHILGKPEDAKSAESMILSLSGRSHQVMSSVAIATHEGIFSLTSITDVEFCHLSQGEAERYCQSGEGLDKAGAYAIQGIAAKFIKSIRGSYSGVVGLPLFETRLLLDRHFKVDS